MKEQRHIKCLSTVKTFSLVYIVICYISLKTPVNSQKYSLEKNGTASKLLMPFQEVSGNSCLNIAPLGQGGKMAKSLIKCCQKLQVGNKEALVTDNPVPS